MEKSKKLILLEKILCLMAILVLKRHKPRIVAITGSVGKTSTREAIFAVLSSKFKVRQNIKNYNNEIGIPLTIIGCKSGGKNLFVWLFAGIKWLGTLINPFYPKILIFELAVDRPDDMKYFMSFMKPYVGVITNISSSHIEYFKSLENIAREKRVLIENQTSDGWAILNADDELVSKMANHTKAQVMTYGTNEDAVVNASGITYNLQQGRPEGISFKLNYDGKNIPIRLRNLLAAHYVYAALAAASVGVIFKINLVEIAGALENLRAPQGRLNLLEGIKGTSVIDDTYNASPASTVSALDVLKQLQVKRKVAILGDMLELGDETEMGHKEVGSKIMESGVDMFIAVGKRMHFAVQRLVALGYPASKIMEFPDPITAAEKIPRFILNGDFILVKGSQGMRMEKVVEKLIAEPSMAEKLLCRQNKEWRKKEFANP